MTGYCQVGIPLFTDERPCLEDLEWLLPHGDAVHFLEQFKRSIEKAANEPHSHSRWWDENDTVATWLRTIEATRTSIERGQLSLSHQSEEDMRPFKV